MTGDKSTYTQRSFFRTGMPLLAAAILILILDLYGILHRGPLLPAVLLLAAGLALIVLGLRSGKKETLRILRFIRDNSALRHREDPSLTPEDLAERLRGEGFSVTGYPYGDYYCHRRFGGKFDCHFFLVNNDEPDVPEAEDFSALFVSTFLSASQTPGRHYVINLKYGPGLEQSCPTYIQRTRECFMYDKSGILFGCYLALDTREGVLYCAEAVTRVRWQKNDAFPIYLGGLLQRLFFPGGPGGSAGSGGAE